tara:strand:+ start:550 stop:1563 length:1014 start_codon:yes stop_codon:yes gene_type:complete
MTVVITGGCGFIGTNFVRNWLLSMNEKLINVDKLSYAAVQETAKIINTNYEFVKLDINQTEKIKSLFWEHKPRAVIHFAAESHVDRSIDKPSNFVETNVAGTFSLLEASKDYFSQLDDRQKSLFKFINISTDEVYGSLQKNDLPFTEQSSIDPSSPYSASKASSDLISRSYYKTYGLPVIISRCSNNFGKYQHQEKFIPTIINSIASGKEIPIYGDGNQVRDWIYVADHVEALMTLLQQAKPGSIYNIGGDKELENINLARLICGIMAEREMKDPSYYDDLIVSVTDRLGHDFRYAINYQKINCDWGWRPKHQFNDALSRTIEWYLAKKTKANEMDQ